VRFAVVAAAAALLLVVGTSCQGHGPSTRSMVFNLAMSQFELESHEVEVGFSRAVYTAHGVTDTLDLRRGDVVGRLVITRWSLPGTRMTTTRPSTCMRMRPARSSAGSTAPTLMR